MAEQTDKKPTKIGYSKNQENIAIAFYVVFVVGVIFTIGGMVWTLAEIFLGQTGKLSLFLDLNLGAQIIVIAALFAGLFFLLVFLFGFFGKGKDRILKWTFKAKEIAPQFKNRTDVKVIASGFLISLIGIIVGVVVFLGMTVLTLLTSQQTSQTLETFTFGQLTLLVGIILFIIDGLSIFIINFLKNGYYMVLKLIGGLEN